MDSTLDNNPRTEAGRRLAALHPERRLMVLDIEAEAAAGPRDEGLREALTDIIGNAMDGYGDVDHVVDAVLATLAKGDKND